MFFENIAEMAVHVQAVDICFSPLKQPWNKGDTTAFHSKVVVKDARKSVIKGQLISDQNLSSVGRRGQTVAISNSISIHMNTDTHVHRPFK